MKYSQDCVWEAVGYFIPGLLYAKRNGCHMNLPTCLADVAIKIFTDELDKRVEDLENAEVIRTALKELESAFMTFGTVEHADIHYKGN
jgi:hypothetical protein